MPELADFLAKAFCRISGFLARVCCSGRRLTGDSADSDPHGSCGLTRLPVKVAKAPVEAALLPGISAAGKILLGEGGTALVGGVDQSSLRLILGSKSDATSSLASVRVEVSGRVCVASDELASRDGRASSPILILSRALWSMICHQEKRLCLVATSLRVLAAIL